MMMSPFAHPSFWLEIRLLSDGHETAAVKALPLTAWHAANNPAFGLFPALPTELRLKVWEYMIAPRIVGIACLCLEDGGSSVETQRNDLWGSHPAIEPSIPALLHVSRETRTLALKHYELSFEWKVPRELAGTDLYPPVRDPFPIPITIHPPPAVSQPDPSGSFSHISTYHDLLDPQPGLSSSSTVGGGIATSATDSFSERRTSSPPRTWFNFSLDAVYLLGELEPCDSFGFNSPMTYFIPPQTTRRVRKVAVSFGALRYGETGGQQVFGTLFHVVDRFAPADGEVLVCVTERDEWTHAMMGNERALVPKTKNPDYWLAMAVQDAMDVSDPDREGNVVQGVWRDWYRGSIIRSPLADMRFMLIEENDLEEQVYNSMVVAPAQQKMELGNGTAGPDKQ
ncbi:hypothetical protein HD806DRAFT_495601 [Xylariaceae sp. AK1471]|nr:hypothetical protein HD806DRAFT_495601 [Xylariaceae sp. AK1471]